MSAVPQRDDPAIERFLGRVLQIGVVMSSVCLGAGLALSLFQASVPLTNAFLQIGLVALMATPAARVAASVIIFTARRDWLIAFFTAVVLVELAASVVAALVFNRQL
jgi:uncharacterized membrane protein